MRMRVGPFCAGWMTVRSCPRRVQPAVAADPERQHHCAAAERRHVNAAGPGIGNGHGREAQRGREEREEYGKLLRRRGHACAKSYRTSARIAKCEQWLSRSRSSRTREPANPRTATRCMLSGHAIHRHPRSDSAEHRHRFMAASALVRHQHVGQAARHLHARHPLPREVRGCARRRDQRRGARRPRHPHARRLPLRRGLRRAELAPLSAAALGRLRGRLTCSPRRREARGCATRPARCSTRSTPRGAGRG